MKANRIICWMALAWISGCASESAAPPSADRPADVAQGSDVPDGFEMQQLELGGQILKPDHWKYESREVGETLVSKMWEPLSNDEFGFDTAVTIDIVTNIPETGQTPSEYAANYLKELKNAGKVVKIAETNTENGRVQLGVLIDQRLKITDVEKEYRIRYVLIADDEIGLLFVTTFGALTSEWDTYEPTFRTMLNSITLIDLSKDAKENE